ncbi:uncharacterized protein LOC127254130 [Andrographis paniculata]|uniref:uncharacterized protein LOC127254130 n=1 Tax=Andrographis paniculata TaxID=175694 RepID=UPI0021E8B44C|nr:uncharacterized protein LOC127254130 [Andrographis paniculata]
MQDEMRIRWDLIAIAENMEHRCAAALEGEDKFPKDTKEEMKKEILARAHSVILLSVIDEVLQEFVDQMTASGLWDKLCEKYQYNSLTNMIYQKQRLYTLRISKSTNIKDYLDTFNRIILIFKGMRLQQRGNGNARSRSKSKSCSKVNFYHCKEKEHIKRDCPQKKKSTKVESSNSSSAAVVQDNSDDGNLGEVLTVCSASTVDT